ncbi:hypothetical protein JF544_18110 [Halobacillus kuroshimensis]|uniref:Uncharacterized protein n=1 Tax=Halobacillus kuroshimensis TaxID=302481 RepID=A0ABS3E0P4_9BACI|nr:hypothetical protein [Halobacillus kuroshimensis]MBN8237164.1 hypothetical protein [Halobacillus kuroshimensis]
MNHNKNHGRRRSGRVSAFFEFLIECIGWVPEVAFGIGRLFFWVFTCIGKLFRGVFDLS